ncbi:MAG: permease-like cell division protein FtsX, partial [Candidatus Staskawiczbacteria bacterium]|nr:permease-like cell division protein FtsX [Candidatus Staskawiczbacteria bacterium]
MFTNFKRVLNFAVKDFSRNKGISIAAIFVLVITTMIVTGLLLFHSMTAYLTSQVQNKIDITAYFKDGTKEQDILDVKDRISKMVPNIKDIEYVSKDQALASFNAIHKDNEILAQALQEVGKNPLPASLNFITNGEPSQYAQIANILKTSDFGDLIDSVDFSQKKDIIEKVYSITSNVNTFGFSLEIILILVAILVVYNTVKLVI